MDLHQPPVILVVKDGATVVGTHRSSAKLLWRLSGRPQTANPKPNVSHPSPGMINIPQDTW
jgi:hypothetical protein